MEFQSFARCAASAIRTYIRALVAVTLADDSLNWGCDIARARRRIGIFKACSRVFCFGEAFGFEPFELLGYRRFDNRGEVVAGHECGEPFELVAELGARGELYFVAAGDNGSTTAGFSGGAGAGAGDAAPSGRRT